MKITAIKYNSIATKNNNYNNTGKQSSDKSPEIYNSIGEIKNYEINFAGILSKEKMPADLKLSDPDEYNPINEKGKNTDKLSSVLSTALSYLKDDRVIILGNTDREYSMDALIIAQDVFSIVEDEDEPNNNDKIKLNNIIFVEDDRIKTEPVIIFKDKIEGLSAIGNITLMDKSGKKTLFNPNFTTPIDKNNQKLKLNGTKLDFVSLNEDPNVTDLKNIKMYRVKDIYNGDENDEDDDKNLPLPLPMPNEDESESMVYTPTEHPVFADIGGNKEAIQRIIEDLYAPLVCPEITGHIMTKGSILEGPSGTGKTMLGRALCNEIYKKYGTGIYLQEVSGAAMQRSPVGGSEARWRKLFDDAIKHQPSIIMIDEIDACIPKRDGSSNARYDNSVVNQLLTLMSDLEKSDNQVYVVGMTNRADAIDPAALRMGRFGNVISCPAPTFDEAKEIYYKVSAKYNIDKDFDVDKFLKRIVKTKGTGSTISGVLENAQKFANRKAGIYSKIYEGTPISPEETKNIVITETEIYKALDAEEEKNKKAKISSDRIVIKGFSK